GGGGGGCDTGTDTKGGSGGGGGAGGNGGFKGYAGKTGGSSFGILSYNSKIIFSEATSKIVGGNGGNGGNGGVGGSGQPGGSGGPRGVGVNGYGRAGDGGRGGNGGKGGSGGNGAGGSAFTYYLYNSTLVEDVTISLTNGTAGNPGQNTSATGTSMSGGSGATGKVVLGSGGGTFTIRATQAITFSNIDNQQLATGSVMLDAVSDSGEPILYSVSGPVTVSGGELTFTGTGAVSVSATQAGSQSFYPSNTISDDFLIRNQPTSQPASASFSSISSSSLEVSFDPLGGIDGYLVLLRESEASTDLPVDGTEYAVDDVIGVGKVVEIDGDGSFTVSGLTPGSLYYFSFFSYVGDGIIRDYLQANPLVKSQATLIPSTTLNAPTNLGQSSFDLSWSAVNGATDYHLDVSTSDFTTLLDGYNGKSLGIVESVTLSGLSSGTTFRARVRAVNSVGASPNSNEVTIVTIPATPAIGLDAVNPTSISISWPTVNGADGFFLDISSDNFVNFVTGYNSAVITGANSYIATGLVPASSYQLRLRSQNTGGSSPNSNILNVSTINIEPIAQPAALSFGNLASNGVSLSFSGATGTPDGYIVIYKAGSAPMDLPVDGISYTAGDAIGSSTVATAAAQKIY
ncbi:MAG: fibronectin type III domain-containing protein, partial [Imperialibacter sp.]|uniref:fibronectin type III domain-containing protein n=1 Tax=Imperialibacter sp. TaxID=2038411 RepID=UPI0032EF0EAB